MLLKPFEDGICINENLTRKHRLLFAKYPKGKHHVLIATKEPNRQNETLTLDLEDFKAVLTAMKSLGNESLMYFNGGQNPYAKLHHKHMNVLPVESLIGGKIPINERVMDSMKSAQVPFSNDSAQIVETE